MWTHVWVLAQPLFRNLFCVVTCGVSHFIATFQAKATGDSCTAVSPRRGRPQRIPPLYHQSFNIDFIKYRRHEHHATEQIWCKFCFKLFFECDLPKAMTAARCTGGTREAVRRSWCRRDFASQHETGIYNDIGSHVLYSFSVNIYYQLYIEYVQSIHGVYNT